MGGDREPKNLRQLTRDRILVEMLGAVKAGGNTTWKVLIVDEVTVKVMSKICKVSDIQEEGISVVEDLKKSRQPQRSLEAVYFIYPSRDSVTKFMEDMSGDLPLYKKAHVFFSTPLPHELLQRIKSSPVVRSRIASLAELNLEFWVVDTQAFITNHELAMRQILGGTESSPQYDQCIDTIASRLGTLFASLKEFPTIRYRAMAPGEASAPTSGRDCAPFKLATALWERLLQYKTLPDYPKSESCDLIILTRAADPIAPIIHEWTYNSLCHDLLDLDGNKFMYEVTTGTGRVEKKEVLLEEHDPVWRELRDMHIADVSLRLDERMKSFKGRNKAAQLRGSGGSRDDISTTDLQKIAQALPMYQDELEKLSLHVHIATMLNAKIKELGLNDLSKVEQDLVFGGASSKELINILSTKDLTTENKVRLLMIYAATHPDKCDATKLQQWLKLARLSEEEFEPVRNMRLLGANVGKKHKITLSYGSKGTKAYRKAREVKEGDWQNARFFPVIEELIEGLSKDNLSKEEYPYFRIPSGSSSDLSDGSSHSARTQGASVRSRRAGNWARGSGSMSPEDSHNGASSHSSHSSSRRLGKRVFVFVLGGMTHSELSAAHKMTLQLNREVIMGSTSLDTPSEFLTKVKSLSEEDQLEQDF